MAQVEEKERGHHIHIPSSTCQRTQDDSKTSTNTSPTEELPQHQPLMRSRPSSSRKVMATEPRVVQIRHAADVDSCTHQENAQHRPRNVTNVEIKTISVCIVSPGAGAGIRDMDQRTQRIDPEVDLPPEVPTA